MAPINVTNLLVKIVSYNNMINKSANGNVNQQNLSLTNQPVQNNIQQNVVTQNLQNPVQQVVQQQVNNLSQQNNIQQNVVTQNLQNPVQQVVQQQVNNLPQQNNIQQNVVTQNLQNPVQQVVQQQVNNLPQQNNIQQNVVTQNLQNPVQQVVQQQVNNLPQQNLIAQNNVQQSLLNNSAILQQNTSLQNVKNENLTAKADTTSILGKTVANNVLVNSSSISKDINIRNQNINYVKEMMNLPQEMKDVLSLVQQAQTSGTRATGQIQSAMLTLGNINITTLTKLIQNGSKEALKQILNNTISKNLSKSDMKQIQEAFSYLNASASSQESQSQALKNFMLLYLPWLPLEEGMDFELDFIFTEASEEDDENILNILIMTKNYGEIHILIILKAMNNFEIYVQCCSKFPKRKLMKLIGEDENKYTLKTNMVFEDQKNYEPKSKTQEAKITLSHVKEISPFLLLIANSIIKNTLLLDSQLYEN